MSNREARVTVEGIRAAKGRRPRPIAITAYDYPIARFVDEAGADIIHVGDSLAMVVLGLEDTTAITMDDICHHLRPVVRARARALITADLPIHSYDTPDKALANARRLVELGADAVKLEGGREILPQIEGVLRAGISVQGHLGMLPQRVREEGGYKRKGKTQAERDRMIDDARALETAGCFSLVLECVVPEVAAEVTQAVRIPTFGIAAGRGRCDGEIRVVHDLLGMFPWFQPPYIKDAADLGERARSALRQFVEREQ